MNKQMNPLTRKSTAQETLDWLRGKSLELSNSSEYQDRVRSESLARAASVLSEELKKNDAAKG